MRTLLAIIQLIASVAVIVLVLLPDSYFERAETAEHFTVTSPAGETFNVVALHRCGSALKQAAEQVLGAQDKKLTALSVDLLTALIKDKTRIIDGNIKDRCEINDLAVLR